MPILRACYRLVLRAYPRTFRKEYGPEMEEVFLHCVGVERARRRGLARALAPVRGFFDAIVHAVAIWRNRPAAQSDPSRVPLRRRRRFVVKQDFRSTVRLARTQPWFVAAVVLMLGLGIGATTAIFSVVYGVLLKPLPFPDANRIFQVSGALPARDLTNISFTEANFWDMRDANRTFDEFGALHAASFSLRGFDTPERVTGGLVSVGFFRALGIQPVAGRLFEPGEDRPGASIERVLLSHGFWTRHFGTDKTAVGRTLMLDGKPFQIVGILPAGTPWLDAADVFVPFIQRTAADRGSWEYTVIGRTKPGVTLEAARGDLQRVARELEAGHPDTNKGLGVTVAASDTWIASDGLRRTLWILLGAVGLLLLIACVNVTNLLLARASGRARESAVRRALGASRFDLIRERLTESVVFSMAGTTVGLLLAAGLLTLFKSLDPGGIPRLREIELNRWVYAFAGGATLLVGLATGLVPALQTPFGEIAPNLRAGQRGSVGDRSHNRVRNVLVAAEVAISLVLLVGAGLLVRSLTQVLTVDRGFQSENRLLVTVSVPASYGGPKINQIATDTLTRLRALPDVLSVASVSGRPLSRGSTGLGIVAADHPNVPEASVPWATWRIVTPDYFKTIGLPLILGRGFTDQDDKGGFRAIISKRLADELWPGQNPIGRTAVLWKGQGNRPGEIIGVVGNMRERGLENEPTFAVYFPAGLGGATSLQLVLHTKTEPQALMPAIRSVIGSIDPNLPVSNVRTLDELVNTSVATRRFTMLLLAAFAGVALILALAGVYGVLAYIIARKTSEIGVRLALGAQHGRVLRLVILQGLRPVAIGIVAGLGATVWISRLMTALLFKVTPYDPLTYVIVCASLALTAALSCYLPARQVLRVDPVEALRAE